METKMEAWKCSRSNGVFLHDITAAILVSQNNEKAAMLVSQTSPVRDELFSYVNTAFVLPINRPFFFYNSWPCDLLFKKTTYLVIGYA